MKEQIKLLIELQKHDARIQELEGMKKVWPQKLEALQGDVKKSRRCSRASGSSSKTPSPGGASKRTRRKKPS